MNVIDWEMGMVEKENNVFPRVPTGASVSDIHLKIV
jgi:hypothetical protein